MIKLNCPNCNDALEVDDGFAGGICRCYDCGTLMTVPASKDGKAEQLKQAGRPSRPGRPARPGEPAPAAPETTAERATTYVTQTGRRVVVSEEQLDRVVVARKARLGVRVGVLVAFIAFFGILGAAVVMLSIHVLKQADEHRAQQQNDPQQVVNGNDEQYIVEGPPNPLLEDKLNLLGLDLGHAPGTTVVTIDTSIAMVRYIELVRAALSQLPGKGDSSTMMLCFATETGEYHYPEQARPPGKWDREPYEQLLGKLDAVGGQNLLTALQLALAQQPARVVLIVSEKPVRFELDKLADALAEAPTTLHVIKLGRDAPAFEELAGRYGGEYLNIPDGQADRWLDEYREKPAGD